MSSFESGARRLRTEPPLSFHDPIKPLVYALNAWLEYLGKRDLDDSLCKYNNTLSPYEPYPTQ